MYSPEEFLDKYVNMPVRAEMLDEINKWQGGDLQIDYPNSLPVAIVGAMRTLEVSALLSVWNVAILQTFPGMRFAEYFLYAPGMVAVAVQNKSEDAVETFNEGIAKRLSESGLSDAKVAAETAAAQLEMLGTATRLLEQNPTGFAIVDHFAYSEASLKPFEEHPYGDLLKKIVGTGAERYKKNYCAVTGQTYTPRAR